MQLLRPRWLYTKGKKEQARKILAKLHSSTGDINSPLIGLEIEEIEEKIALDGADSKYQDQNHWVPANDSTLSERPWDFRPLFIGGRGIRYRTYMVILIGIFGQLSGNGVRIIVMSFQ